MQVLSRSVEETEQLGVRLGALLRPDDFIGLAGTLGAGKTAFVRGLARGAEVPSDALVSSPTFAIVNAYRGGRLTLFHCDLYRVTDAEELYDFGYYDLIESGSATIVEWIDKIPDAEPAEWLEIQLTYVPEGRALVFVAHGARAADLITQLRVGGP